MFENINIEKKDKIKRIFKFLKENREYNKNYQTLSYKKAFSISNNNIEKVLALCYDIINTLPSTKIDSFENFFTTLLENKNKIITFKWFVELLWWPKNSNSYKDLYTTLQKQYWWWDKMSALFVKVVYHLHNCNYLWDTWKFWEDYPKEILDNDLELPVDIVIKHIFYMIVNDYNFDENYFTNKITVSTINNFLRQNFPEETKWTNMEIWDDLWFWGYFTQKVFTKWVSERMYIWNNPKYLLDSLSDKNNIEEIRRKAEEFINILKK